MIEFAHKPGWTSLVIGVVLFAILVWSFRRSAARTTTAKRIWLLALRVLVVAVLAICLWDPQRVREVHRLQPGWVALLLDTSKSMGVTEGGRPRLDAAKLWIRDTLRLPRELELRAFSFSQKLEPLATVDTATTNGTRTETGAALEALRTAPARDSLRGVVLISDGAENGSVRGPEVAKQFGLDKVPIFTLCVGATNEEPDLRIAGVDTQPVYLNQGRIRVGASLASPGFAGLRTELHLRQEGTLLAKQGIVLNGGTQRVEFVFPPTRQGFQTMEIEVPVDQRERKIENNRREFGLTVNDSRVRVIYMEATGAYFGIPEVLHLTWALEDEGFEVRPLCHEQYGPTLPPVVRDAPAFQDPRGGQPLYRVENSRVGYPKSLEELLRFDVVICSDIERAVFTPEQLQNTVRFVEEYGGGFVMIGGATAYGSGRWQETPWEKIIPVEMATERDQRGDMFQPRVPPESVNHPLLKLADNAQENRRIWTERFPPLAGYNSVDRAKPGAATLLVHPRQSTRYGPNVILAAQEVGKGRTMAFTSDTTAVWGYEFERYWGEPDPNRKPAPAMDVFAQRPSACDNRYYRRFWANAVRWLAANKITREQSVVQIVFDKFEVAPKEQVAVSVKAADKLGQAVSGASVTLSLSQDNAELQTVPAQEGEIKGTYRANLTPPSPGRFVVSARVRPNGSPEFEAKQLLVCKERDGELADSRARPELLAQIAQNSGGQTLSLTTETGKISEALTRNKSQVTEYKREPLWDTWVWLGLFVGLLTLEWITRRRLGLA